MVITSPFFKSTASTEFISVSRYFYRWSIYAALQKSNIFCTFYAFLLYSFVIFLQALLYYERGIVMNNSFENT